MENSEKTNNENIIENKKFKKKEKQESGGEKKKETKHRSEEEYITLWNVWNFRPPLQIPGTPQLTFKGWSIAALRTNFYIKEIGLMLDGGLSSPTVTINYMLITHCHSDHIANVPFHLYSYKEPEKIHIMVPGGMEDHLKQYIESCYLLSSNTFPEEENIKREDLHLYKFFDIITVEPGNKIEIFIKKIKYGLEIFKCYHTVPCVGYGLYEIRKKLKEEYTKLSGKEIGELRKKNIEINYEYEKKIFVYLGDTGKEIFEDKKQWTKIMEYPTIIIECTFISEEDKEQADKTKHIHWDDIEPIIDANPNNTFILIHFSQRYDNSQIKEFFKDKNKKNVIPWI